MFSILVGSSPETSCPRVLFGNSHGIAIELLGQIRAKRVALREDEQPCTKIMDDAGCVFFFLGLTTNIILAVTYKRMNANDHQRITSLPSIFLSEASIVPSHSCLSSSWAALVYPCRLFLHLLLPRLPKYQKSETS